MNSRVIFPPVFGYTRGFDVSADPPTLNPHQWRLLMSRLIPIATVILSLTFAITAAADDAKYVKIVNVSTGKVLALVDDSEEGGARATLAKDEGGEIIQWDDKTEDNDNQRWSWDGSGDERRLKSKNSGMVLDVNTEGKVIQKKPDEKAKSQLWRVVDVKE